MTLRQRDTTTLLTLDQLIGLVLAICLVFLQSGFSYYLSNQTLAVAIIGLFILSSRPILVKPAHQALLLILLLLFTGATAVMAPMVISRNSTHIPSTIARILVFALVLITLPRLRFQSAARILKLMKRTTGTVIVVLFLLLVVSELNIIPGFNRDYLMLQNAGLVTNNSADTALQAQLALDTTAEAHPRPDLFYGEPSFLAIVFFSCAVSYLLIGRLNTLVYSVDRGSSVPRPAFMMSNWEKAVLSLAIFSLAYQLSLSALVYAMILAYYTYWGESKLATSSRRMQNLVLLAIFICGFIAVSGAYFANRLLTLGDSISFIQRFGPVAVFGLKEYLFGVHDISKIPEVGFQNGLIYILAIAGSAGILYVGLMLRTAIRLSRYLELSPLVALAVLALIMQNGDVFSPNKAVLFALVFLPLTCLRSLSLRGPW